LYLIGLFDEKKIKSWQEENSYSMKDLNPFFLEWRDDAVKRQERLENKFNKFVEVFKEYVKKTQG
jgi:hypothetical protein